MHTQTRARAPLKTGAICERLPCSSAISDPSPGSPIHSRTVWPTAMLDAAQHASLRTRSPCAAGATTDASLEKSRPVGSQPPTLMKPVPWLYWEVPAQPPSTHVLPKRSVRLLGKRRRVLSLPSPRSTIGLRQLMTSVMTYVPFDCWGARELGGMCQCEDWGGMSGAVRRELVSMSVMLVFPPRVFCKSHKLSSAQVPWAHPPG